MTNPYEPFPTLDYYSALVPRISVPKKPPYLLYGFGVGRTATTASLNVFASSSIKMNNNRLTLQVVYQQLKAGFRNAMHNWPLDDGEHRWGYTFPDFSKAPVFYTKDTLGPYTKAESEFDPINIFQRIGYPTDMLNVIFFVRDPIDCLVSWIRNWSTILDRKTLLQNFIISQKTIFSMINKCDELRIPNSTFLYESLRDHDSGIVVQRLFDKINIDMSKRVNATIQMTERSVRDWDQKQISKISYPPSPSIYSRKELAKLDDEVTTKTSLQYKCYSSYDQIKTLTPSEINQLIEQEIFKIYEFFRLRYVTESKLHISETKEIKF